MKKNLSLLILAAAALAFSCSKELTDPTKKDQGETVNQTFTAVQEGFIDNTTNTKATFDRGICWQVNDEIAISDGTTQSIFVATAVDEAGKATFSLKAGETPLATSGVTYKAWYPVDIAPNGEGVMTRPQQEIYANGEIPSGKTVHYSQSIYTSNPMYAESSNTNLPFKNLCGLLKITYSGKDIAHHRKIIESYTEPVWGPYTIVNNTMVLSGTDDKYGRMEVKSTNAKYVNQSGVDYVKTYYYAIPAGTYNSLLILNSDNSSQTKPYKWQPTALKEGKTLTVERNKVYAMNITLDDFQTDLSAEARTANCYTFSSGGTYIFRATRGNERAAISGIDHVDVVWRAQSYNTSSFWDAKNQRYNVVHNPTYKNGYIKFYGNGSQANAVIAAYDASGEILWSWHIWSLNSARPVKSVTVNGLTMLDRNLGAIYADTYTEGDNQRSYFCAGYLYQWGRKDPFPGRGQEKSNNALIKMLDKNDVCLGTLSGTTMTAPPTTTGPVTVAETIKHPETFVKTTSNGAHWASDIADTWGGEKKTIYDPCPYGYRVPKLADFSANWKIDNFTARTGIITGSITAYLGFDYSDGTNNAFFPITGQLSWNGGTLSGTYVGSDSTNSAEKTALETYGRIWTCESNHTYLQVNCTIPAKGSSTTAKEWNDRIEKVNAGNIMGGYAMAVRCVKE